MGKFGVHHCWRWMGAMVLLGLLAPIWTVAAAPNVDPVEYFEKNVRPLFVEACQSCHGPKRQESSLRLDSREAVLKGGDSGPAVVPGAPAKSLLLAAVSQDGDLRMPPEAKLRPDQVAVLKTWIELGAPWGVETPTAKLRSGEITAEERGFWSFRPPVHHGVPTTMHPGWGLSPIDAFVLAKLEAKGLAPPVRATKRELIRRATFDLTGLPPTPEEIASFLADDSSGAFEKVVDRLLATRAYGEHWGRKWLDVVRYADTAGETADYPIREAWRYRNYVIDSFARDKPYDEFLREQIAGDLFAVDGAPERFADRIVATGFIASSRRFGFDSENYHHLTIQDTIDTLGQAALGLTIGCARCHDHKYDPVLMEDYYGWYGIFSSTRYAFPGSEEKKRPRDFVPLVPPAEAAKRLEAHNREISAIDHEIKSFETEAGRLSAALSALVDVDGGFECQNEGAPPSTPWGHLEGARVSAAAQSPWVNVHPKGRVGVRLPTGTANNATGQLLVVKRTASSAPKVFLNIDLRCAEAGPNEKGSYRIYWGHGPGNSAAIELFIDAGHFYLRSGDKTETARAVSIGEWVNVQLALDLKTKTYSGVAATAVDAVRFENKRFAANWDGVIDYFFVDGYGHLPGPKPVVDVDNMSIQDSPFASPSASSAAARGESLDLARMVKQKLAALVAQKAEWDAKKKRLSEKGPFDLAYAVMEGTAADAAIQRRGEPDRPGPIVPRRMPRVFDPAAPSASGAAVTSISNGSGRRELAEWLTWPEHPLTARVMVNRVWQGHFGHGLVRTENDFGTRGERPSHPELLDELALQFIKAKWSIKAMHKLMMLSATYQASASASDPQGEQVDPENRLLWRFPRRRLDAEAIRDSLLALGGQLDRSPGEGHPFPPVETWGFSQHAPFLATYPSDKRSVYLMTQRIRRHPFLALFDGADPNVTTSKRGATVVPTQALFFLNDPSVHEQSRGFARRLIKAERDPSRRIESAYIAAFGRPPDKFERFDAKAFLSRYDERLASRGMGEKERELEALAGFARTLFANSEFIYVD